MLVIICSAFPHFLHCITWPALSQAMTEPDLPPGDLVYELRELRHPRFERRGDDLLCTVTVPLHQARSSWTVGQSCFACCPDDGSCFRDSRSSGVNGASKHCNAQNICDSL